MFETIKAFVESKDETATKDKFQRAKLNGLQIGTRAEAFLKQNQK